jgi:hypothetical protein
MLRVVLVLVVAAQTEAPVRCSPALTHG